MTARRAKADFARWPRRAVGERHPEAEVITLAVDNWNAPRPAVPDEVFGPAAARRMRERLALVYAPKHARWRNVAEFESGVLARPGLGRRRPDQEVRAAEGAAGERGRAAARGTVAQQFAAADARGKLKRLYPTLEPVQSAALDH